jgi:hypothetical protein
MNRLQSELHRLYLVPDPGAGANGEARLIGPLGTVRALVMELAHPADWDVLSAVWRGVQIDLQLPAPAIAVSGSDGLQLWFSLAEPVDASRAAAFLAQLRSRYLADIAPARLRLMPSATNPSRHAALVPAPQDASGNWSAFVAPDLAPVFADTPWLDIPPGPDGQADLLARLESIKPAAFDAAMQRLVPVVPSTASTRAPAAQPSNTGAHTLAADAPNVDPKRFLQQVLNDETVALALRIEAAKALLRGDGGPAPDEGG